MTIFLKTVGIFTLILLAAVALGELVFKYPNGAVFYFLIAWIAYRLLKENGI